MFSLSLPNRVWLYTELTQCHEKWICAIKHLEFVFKMQAFYFFLNENTAFVQFKSKEQTKRHSNSSINKFVVGSLKRILHPPIWLLWIHLQTFQCFQHRIFSYQLMRNTVFFSEMHTVKYCVFKQFKFKMGSALIQISLNHFTKFSESFSTACNRCKAMNFNGLLQCCRTKYMGKW